MSSTSTDVSLQNRFAQTLQPTLRERRVRLRTMCKCAIAFLHHLPKKGISRCRSWKRWSPMRIPSIQATNAKGSHRYSSHCIPPLRGRTSPVWMLACLPSRVTSKNSTSTSRWTTKDWKLVINLFKGYQNASDPELVRYSKQKAERCFRRRRWHDSRIDHDARTQLVRNTYQTRLVDAKTAEQE